jgi:hypothetical protein
MLVDLWNQLTKYVIFSVKINCVKSYCWFKLKKMILKKSKRNYIWKEGVINKE